MPRKRLDQLPDPAQRGTISVDEAAPFIGVPRGALYEALHRGEVPHLRFGKRYLIPTQWVADVIAGRVDTPTREAADLTR